MIGLKEVKEISAQEMHDGIGKLDAQKMKDGIDKLGALCTVIDCKLLHEYGTGSKSLTLDVTRYHERQIEFAVFDLKERGYKVIVNDYTNGSAIKMLNSKKKTIYVTWC